MKNHKYRISTKIIGALMTVAAVALGANVWAYQSQSSNANGVRIDVVPAQLSSGKPVKFEVRMNTHSVNLGYDMVAAALLKDGQGRTYNASAWNGSAPGGHHRSGVLEFPAVAENAKSVTLYFKNISGVPERIFEWKIE
ncbi:MAG: hypothetical protein AB1427_03220 [Thermodesulfobacteriota bacterium]